MKNLSLILAGAALALSGGAAVAADTPSKAEVKLNKMLEGRIAGEPTRCINAIRSEKLEVIDRVGVAYDAGDTIYLARASDPDSLRDRDILIVDRFGAQLCTSDVKQTVGRYDGMLRSVVFLDDFVPYRRG